MNRFIPNWFWAWSMAVSSRSMHCFTSLALVDITITCAHGFTNEHIRWQHRLPFNDKANWHAANMQQIHQTINMWHDLQMSSMQWNCCFWFFFLFPSLFCRLILSMFYADILQLLLHSGCIQWMIQANDSTRIKTTYVK